MIFLRMPRLILRCLSRRQDGGAPRLRRALLVLIFLDHLVHEVADPGADGLDDNLRAFLFEEAEHVEVAVALGGLGPEFAGDLDDGLHAGAVDGDGLEAVAHLAQGGHQLITEDLVQEFAEIFGGAGEARAAKDLGGLAVEGPGLLAAHHFVQQLHGLFQDAVGLARRSLRRAGSGRPRRS
jgi:hypothetical protein